MKNKIIFVSILLISLFITTKVNALAYPVTYNNSGTSLYNATYQTSKATSVFSQGFWTGTAVYVPAGQPVNTFNSGRYAFSLGNDFTGVYNVSFTLAYAYNYEAPDNAPVVTFDQVSCKLVNVVNIAPDSGSGFLSQMATYTCYGYIYANSHFIDFAGGSYSWVGLHNIVDISGTEGETLYYLQAINNQLSNFGYGTLSNELRENNNYNFEHQTNSINNNLYANTQSIIANQNANSQAQISAINNVNSTLEEIQDTDISSQDKQPIDSTDFDDYQEAEDDLFDKMEQVDTDSLDFAIDIPTSNFVWETITRLFNSNALLMNFLITILSIGVIKFALAR